ncbi:hypothetical protein NKH99_28485 [Mesorhizobium sp. M0854]|uniref:hypothetical protein n=1 Tax=Mesorhizobium sp. M0854 TaxID=2957013 RepID=UPI00333779E9
MEIDMFDWNRSCSYDEQHKRRFHATARSRLKKLAAELNLPSGCFDLRSNKAGIAVSDEIILHHDRAYIQVGQFGLSSGHGILIRTCKGRMDYTGGANHFVALDMLDDIPALAAASAPSLGLVETVRVPPNGAPPEPCKSHHRRCTHRPQGRPVASHNTTKQLRRRGSCRAWPTRV